MPYAEQLIQYTHAELTAQMHAKLHSSDDLYLALNALRDWFNSQFYVQKIGFDLYLEDEWNERTQGETHLEYRLRSLHTKDELSEPFAYDIYLNHQDAKGVWHLDDYQRSVLILEKDDIVTTLSEFMTKNDYPFL